MAPICILVVYDPTTDAQPALGRAAALARNAKNAGVADLKLYVYSCIYSKMSNSEEEAEHKAELIAAQEEIVAKTVAAVVDKEIEVATVVEWDKDWHQAVVRAADRVGAAAVFKSSYKRSATRRLLKNSSDRALLRQCSCPVLLVKSDVDTTRSQRVILAAVQFRGESGAYDDLNRRIVDLCQSLFATDDVKVHFINAYTELSDRPDKGELVRACGVPSDQAHIKVGETDDVIVEMAQELDADIVVIGNSARDGFAAVINNNTAEKILDRLDCNLLALPDAPIAP